MTVNFIYSTKNNSLFTCKIIDNNKIIVFKCKIVNDTTLYYDCSENSLYYIKIFKDEARRRFFKITTIDNIIYERV